MKQEERDSTAHWQDVYERKDASGVSWYQDAPTLSLEWIREVAPAATKPRILDAGGGASTLVDHLLNDGYGRVTVLDLADSALATARARLGDRAGQAQWIAGDVLEYAPAEPLDVWHDRAVLHFLTSEGDQQRYADVLRDSLRPGSHAIIATFAPGGPTRCSGLQTEQYDGARVRRLLGDGFELLREVREVHRTPSGADQLFSWFLLRKR